MSLRENNSGNTINSGFLQVCDIAQAEFKVKPFTIIIFGGAGDLSRRKLLPTLFHLYSQSAPAQRFSVLGFGLPEMNDEGYRKLAREAIMQFGSEFFDQQKWIEFSKRIFYLSASFTEDKHYKLLCDKIPEITPIASNGAKELIYYLAVPQKFTPVIVERLSAHKLCKGIFNTKIIIEKPFGNNRETAVVLNRILNDAFDEPQIYRIDHYLAKETVQNIIFFRFSNSIFEPLWNRRYIDHVQITAAENMGVEHRGEFYEQAGVIRDIVQNHIMQLIALVAMEPPVGFAADLVRDEKVKIFRSLRRFDNELIDKFTVRGQYAPGEIKGEKVCAYRKEKDVSKESNIPTFFAGKFYIDNWRWAGVPFYIRAGKRLARQETEIVIQFKQPPLKLFGRSCDPLGPNYLILKIQPQEKILLRFGVKYPKSNNEIYPVDMEFGYQDAFKLETSPPYERLLLDCMKGDLTLFVRQDGVEAMWQAVDPIVRRWELNPPMDFPNYQPGSWGPRQSDAMLEQDGRSWINLQLE